ncbi:hypothetical protein GJ744_005537 [Endocarpon pusillum]|uniref:Uncharacterized protein n=1 Tax=Endocarpon pusillum TaxID=364733 RepID=A0A8H7APT7_9EURO|nr:hypothetical protein GJ744_005537 [Endocarpon pusillum]
MDNMVGRAILNPNRTLRDEAITALEAENEVNIIKIVWLSNRCAGKAYESMAVCFVKREQAVQALQTGYFSVSGGSAYTSVFRLE